MSAGLVLECDQARGLSWHQVDWESTEFQASRITEAFAKDDWPGSSTDASSSELAESKNGTVTDVEQDLDDDDEDSSVDYEAEIADVVRLEIYCPPVGGDDSNDQLLLDVPATTLSSKNDPMLFYRIPHGFGLWEASHALMVSVNDMIEKYTDITRELRVIELGSGAAPLPSMMVAKLLQQRERQGMVVATDHIDSLVSRCAENVNLNKVSNSLDSVSCYVEKLSWGDAEMAQEVMRLGMPNDALQPEAFDVILGSDLVGMAYCMSQLAQSVNDLSAIGSVLVMSVAVRTEEAKVAFLDALYFDGHCKWDLVETLEDDRVTRWRKYGRVAHNANAHHPENIQIWVLRKTGVE